MSQNNLELSAIGDEVHLSFFDTVYGDNRHFIIQNYTAFEVVTEPIDLHVVLCEMAFSWQEEARQEMLDVMGVPR